MFEPGEYLPNLGLTAAVGGGDMFLPWERGLGNVSGHRTSLGDSSSDTCNLLAIIAHGRLCAGTLTLWHICATNVQTRGLK